MSVRTYGPSGARRARSERPAAFRAIVAAAGLGLALLLAVQPAVAQERQQRRTPGREAPGAAGGPGASVQAERLVERFAARVAQALDLDRDERERLLAELQRSRRERATLAQRRREVMRELSRLVTAGSLDQGRVERLFEEFLELRVRQARIDVEEDRRLAEFLTPLQRARLFHLKQRLAERALNRDRVDRRP